MLQQVTTANGVVVPVTSYNPHYAEPQRSNAAIVFNTNPLSSPEDNDLGTPNWVHGGTGTGDAGISGPYINDKALGKLAVLHNYKEYPVSEPNDDDFRTGEEAGWMRFNFSNIGTVTATSITVIDIEGAEAEYGKAELYNSSGALISTVDFPSTGSNGVAVVSLGNVAGVSAIRVIVGGSFGVDNLQFCRSTTPPPTNQCTYTQGYWKNHPNAWPVSSLTLGSVTYTKEQLLSILKTPVKGNGLVSLAHQLIAAKLNVANGTNPAAISTSINQADALIGNRNILNGGYLAPSATSTLTDKLDAYNNGKLGTPHCG
ncbi:hypothetical protein ASU33_10080 [Solirubrum puertoriconensis]|uniref:Uncharacterized protein n=1 Tax=Solirubrum puertoriconensis TaxID=1751427 RepID=A0A9X0HM42_SOLP1|nr:hypothetical protein ASU33_10080 [Solirubrum puertoriconensis]